MDIPPNAQRIAELEARIKEILEVLNELISIEPDTEPLVAKTIWMKAEALIKEP